MSVTQEAQDTVVEQDKYENDKTFDVFLLLLLALAFAAGLFGLIILLRHSASPPPTYFSATDQNQLIAEAPLDQASIDPAVLLNWVTEATMAAGTFNFVNYVASITAANVYFTKEGFDSYNSALLATKIIDRVVTKKLVLTAIPTDAPQVLLEKPLAGRYMWKIRAPMRFTYHNVTTDVGDLVDVTIIVMRVPTAQSPNGVSILKYDLNVKGRG